LTNSLDRDSKADHTTRKERDRMRLPIRIALPVALTAALLAVVPLAPAEATFPGSNGLIVWSKVFLTRDAELFVMNPDGSNQVQLSHNHQVDFDPAWSADGTLVAFTSCTGDDCDVWVMNSDGTGEHNVSNDPTGPDIQPGWSPDALRIAFVKQNFDGTSAIWVMDADGSNQTALTDDITTNTHPNWSPDGALIAFSSDRDGGRELYTIAPDGSNLTRITFTARQHEDNPNWSPNGRLILFDACVAATFPCPGSANYEIWAMRADGSGRRRLTNDPTIDWNAAWSPDGTQIVFRSDRSPDGTELYRMDDDGSNVVQLTFGPFQGGVDPDWQPLP
jgi:Tol biopolymer transport system component